MDGKSFDLDEKLSASLYPDTERKPMVLVSGDFSKAEDKRVFNELVSMQGRIGFHTYNTENLWATHIQKAYDRRTREHKYLVTYVFSRKPNNPRPSRYDLYYVQYAARRKAGESTAEYGLPIAVDGLSIYMTEGEQNKYIEGLIGVLAERHEGVADKMYKEKTTAERIYRSGMSPGEIRQIDANHWGIRLEGRDKFISGRFILIRRNAEGRLECKTVELLPSILKEELSQEEAARRWANYFEGRDRTAGARVPEVELTYEEREFGKYIEQSLEGAEWEEVPEDILDKIKVEGLPYEHIEPVVMGEYESFSDILNKMGVGVSHEYRDAVEIRLAEIDRALEEKFPDDPNKVRQIKNQFLANIETAMAEGGLPENEQEVTQRIQSAANNVTGDDGLIYHSLL